MKRIRQLQPYALFCMLMKISLTQLCIAFVFASFSYAHEIKAQDVLDRSISLKMENTDLRKVLSSIEDQTGVKFVYSRKTIKADRPVSIHTVDQKLSTVLTTILSPLDISYQVVSGRILLTADQMSAIDAGIFEASANVAPALTVTGKVTDDKGEGVPGVSVVLKGTTTGTVTNTEGVYSLTVPDGSGTLVFSFIGYTTQEVAIGNRTTVDVTLGADVTALNEVVVVGYGTQQKKDLTGAVAVVNVDQMTKQPTAQVENMLQGQAAGVTVLGSGQPGQSPRVQIRGFNTFGNNQPLYVIDGVPTQNINDINPNDIQTMQVLKDAGSASIYGSRAANGVVIITTKKGASKIKVTYDAYYGVQVPKGGNVWNTLSPQGMADLRRVAKINSGAATNNDEQYREVDNTFVLPDYLVAGTTYGAQLQAGNPALNESLYNVNPNYTSKDEYDKFYRIVRANKSGTDWFHEIFKNAPITSHNLSLSGGGDQGSYFFSVNYFNQQGTLINTYNKRYTIRSNSQYNVSKHIRIGENLAFSVTDNPRVATLDEGSAIGHAFREQPIIPVYDIAGNFAGSFAKDMGNARNPVAIQKRTANNRGLSNRLIGNIYGEVDLFNHFTARTSFGGELYNWNSRSFSFPEYENAENNTANSYTEQNGSGFNWTWTNTVNYHQNFNQIHDIKVVVGTEAYNAVDKTLGGTTQGYFSFDPNYTNLTTGAASPTNYSTNLSNSLFALIGRVDYNLKDKYLLGFVVRRDGSSKFLKTQYGWFPAVSAAWRISQEEFMKNISWLTDLKLRAGYGSLGNQLNVRAGNAFTTYGSNRSSTYYDLGGTNSTTVFGINRTQIGAPNAKWESVINSNVGLDATLFSGALDVTVDYYNKEIRDLLYNPELPGTAGSATAPFINVAQMRNQGLDASVTGHINVTNDLKLNITGTITTYNNKILKVSNGAGYFDEEGRRFNGSFIVRNQVGSPLGSFFGYKLNGFWDDQAEIDAANEEARSATGNATAVYQSDIKVGRFRYADINGDGRITDADRTVLGNPNPKFTYGLNISATYKNFDFFIFLYGSQGNDIWNNVKWWTDFYPNFLGAKSKTALYDSWTPEHHNAKAPIQETGGSFSTTSVPNSYYVEKGSYLRAKNVQLGYSLPTSLLQKVRVERLRVYVQAANLFTLTKYSGVDPEVGFTNADRNTTFNIDEGAYPNQRQFIMGLNLTF
ncbi:TonB-dependent receptor [Cytophagaceae bacterium YF14B1]|uniref:TonB-dependent receptor n=1 Tax=Xanthocytophaga flava TaxID=3048013 RepID=A0AAE3QTN7_9BACT|nr:TonB-dependent receptor [Xanthocytophaga flavus]MDJ1484746.1 TonB-dependent receptor [Xanthocytophaga flavus]